jgi:hypothetical protein
MFHYVQTTLLPCPFHHSDMYFLLIKQFYILHYMWFRCRWLKHSCELTRCLWSTMRCGFCLFVFTVLEFHYSWFIRNWHIRTTHGAMQPETERVYSSYLELDLSEVEPCVSGPKR